jgi:hypothetical protein
MKLPLALLARALALLWAGFWMFFFVVESAVWHTPVSLALPWVGVGLLFIFSALVPWRWEMIGGLLLVVIGLSAGVVHAIWWPSRLLTTVAFSAPPLAAGILFLTHRRSVTANA